MSKHCGYIALAGRPNAGKSTFLNYVLGEKVSIVSDKPQTTRNRILGVYHRQDLQIGFLDLPGIHKPKFKMNRLMMRSVQQGLEDADLIFHFIDASVPTGKGDLFVKDYLAKKEIPIFLVLNKMDLVNQTKSIPLIEKLYQSMNPRELVPVSSLSGNNIDRLLNLAAAYLPEEGFLFQEDALTDQPIRFMAAELIREKLLHYTHDELPHAVAVSLESYEFDEEEDAYFIAAKIWVEKDTQRKIVLGAGGRMIGKIRRGARTSIKKLLGKPVHLELFVKVFDKWRNHERLLGNLETPLG